MLPVRLSVLFVSSWLCFAFSLGAETNLVAGTTNAAPALSNVVEIDTQMLRALLLLQEQMRATQREIAEARLEADEASKRASEILAARLNLIEQSLTLQRQREFDTLQSSNQLLLIVVGVVATIGFLSIAFSGWLQTRAVNRLSEVSEQLRLSPLLPAAAPLPQLANGDAAHAREPVHPVTDVLAANLQTLQRRIDDLEHVAHSDPLPELTGKLRHEPAAIAPAVSPHTATLLGKAQALLNNDQPAEALAVFDEVLGSEPKNVEAWIKKGTALERLQRPDEAISAYDQAIAADGTTATAYLFKAGVYNRQKRYAEALHCYEKALSVQKSRGAAATVMTG